MAAARANDLKTLEKYVEFVSDPFHSSYITIQLSCFIHCQNERNSISVANLNMRTTSSLEAMNSVIQRTFPSKTNMYKFMENLKMHEAIKSSDMYQLSMDFVTNEHLERRRKEDKIREEKIKTCNEMLENEEISVAEFLALICKKKFPRTTGTYFLFIKLLSTLHHHEFSCCSQQGIWESLEECEQGE